MASFFNTSTAIMGLSVGIYLGSSAIFQILAGPLSDNVGRRTFSIGALIIFIVASLGCIYSTSVENFMIFRAVPASACLMVIARAIVRDTTSTEKSGARIAYISLGMAISPMLGPAVGGFLGGLFGWEANFWLIVLLGLQHLLLFISTKEKHAHKYLVVFGNSLDHTLSCFHLPYFGDIASPLLLPPVHFFHFWVAAHLLEPWYTIYHLSPGLFCRTGSWLFAWDTVRWKI